MSERDDYTGGFWGPPFEPEPSESAVVELLKKAAEELAGLTKGWIVGEVEEDIDSQRDTRWVSLYLKVPGLEDYRHKLVAVAHPFWGGSEFPLKATQTVQDENPPDINNIEEFQKWLKTELSTKETRQQIMYLWDQARRIKAS